MRRALRAQQGVVLFIALIILVAMTLAGIALMRGVDTGTVIAGNIAFRQNTMFVADLGVEAARGWLQTNSGVGLNNDQSPRGYYATWGATTDLLGNDTDPATTPFNWTANGILTAAPFAPPSGYEVRYVIHRLCETTGDPSDPAAICTKSAGAAASTSAGTKGAAAYGTYALASPVAATYRVTVQVVGPRNARSYIQATLF